MMHEIRISTALKELCGVMFLHDYYADGLCRDLEIQPTESTQELMRNFALLYKPVPYGFMLFYSPDRSERILNELPPQTKLSFEFRTRKTTFQNYTSLPYSVEGEVLYFSNSNGTEATIERDFAPDVYFYFQKGDLGESRKKLLHLDRHFKVGLRPQKFNQTFFSQAKGSISSVPTKYNDVRIADEWGSEENSSKQPIKLGLQDVLSGEVMQRLERPFLDLRRKGLTGDELAAAEKKLIDELAHELGERTSVSHSFDLRHCRTGLYKISAANTEESWIYTHDHPDPFTLGVLDLYLTGPEGKKLNNPAFEIKTGDENEPIVDPGMLYLHFESRKTFWKYHFLNYQDSKVLALEIRDELEQTGFEALQEERLSLRGVPALVSTSKLPLPFMEKPDHTFWLKRRSGKRNMKDMKLPSGRPDIIRPVQNGSELTYFTDIYVYL